MTSSALKKQLAELKAEVGGDGKLYVVCPQWEPLPIDTRESDSVLLVDFTSSDNGEVVPSHPYINLDEPLTEYVEELLASGVMSGDRGYHKWNPHTREFVSPYGLCRPAMPKVKQHD